MIKNIVIVGGGSAGWISASYLSKQLKDVNIKLIESPDIPVIGVGESTVPPVVDFMKSLGIEEKDWMSQCNAVYKGSICFNGFYEKNDPPFWFPFCRTWSVADEPANRYWLYKHYTDEKFSDRFSLYDYTTLVPEICRQGKTVRSIPTAGYAYHFDAAEFGEVLKKYAVKNGVEYISDTVTKVVQNEDGSIKEVELKNGKPVAGDLFIDCSGFKSLLIGETLNEPFDEFYDTLFNDRAIAMQVDYEDKDKEMTSYTNCTTLSSGWSWNIPLYNRIGTGYVYSSKHQSEDEAEQEFRNHLGADRVKDLSASHIKIRVGKHRRIWVKNCVAIGLSSGFIEPLESTGIQIFQSEVHLLAEVLRGKNDFNIADIELYNESITNLLVLIRDFLVCHYALTNREDTPYWKDVKYNTKVPASVTKKLITARLSMPTWKSQHYYDEGGSLAGFGFNEGWYSILAGMNHLPYGFDLHREREAGAFDRHLKENMAEADKIYTRLNEQRKYIAGMPSHYQYLKDNIFDGRE